MCCLKTSRRFSSEIVSGKGVPQDKKNFKVIGVRGMRLKSLELYTENPVEEFVSSGHRACQGCAEILALRLALKVFGKDTIICMATGCMEIISTPLPTTAWKLPWIHVAFENAAAVASGVEAGIKILMEKGKIPRKDIHVVAIAGDGGTSDIGLQALSGRIGAGPQVYLYLR